MVFGTDEDDYDEDGIVLIIDRSSESSGVENIIIY